MNKPNGISDKVWEMANDPKPYGIGAGRLWLEGHLTKLDPKIGEPYASQVVAEIDSYIDRVVAMAISKAVSGERGSILRILEDSKFARETASRSALSDGDVDASVIAAFQARHAGVLADLIRSRAKGQEQ